eukprot:5057862-Prymnesium_polylepis.1
METVVRRRAGESADAEREPERGASEWMKPSRARLRNYLPTRALSRPPGRESYQPTCCCLLLLLLLAVLTG